ncbi:membrane protein insertase YidC [Paenibacillus larvae]
MIRRFYKITPLLLLFLLLAGCSSPNQPIDPVNGGFFTKYFIYPLSWCLDWFAGVFGNSYGISILILTIIIRFIVLPLTLKQYRSSKRMQEIQPEIKKLQQKYKDNPQKQQEETMKLFQQHGVNPLAGCLPLLIQMPILIALYQAIMRNDAIREHTFLWLQLGAKDDYYILPLIAAITTYLQQKTMSAQMNQQMKSMLFIFPVLIFVMSMSFASALPLYWIYSNLFTIAQNYFLYGRDNRKKKDEAAAEAIANESKPKGKKNSQQNKGGRSK